MPNNYDDVVKQNKKYLTKAQVNSLAAASKAYGLQNAGTRAGALSQAREQYDAGVRGLQNMGLAGNANAAPTSGEVPRLQTQIQQPFQAYNQRLQDVENQRLSALGAAMKKQTIAQRAAAYAARQKQLQAANVVKAATSNIANTIQTLSAVGKAQQNMPGKQSVFGPVQQKTSQQAAEAQQQVETQLAYLRSAAQLLGTKVDTKYTRTETEKLANNANQAKAALDTERQKTGMKLYDDLVEAKTTVQKAERALDSFNNKNNYGYDAEEDRQNLKAAQANLEKLTRIKNAREGTGKKSFDDEVEAREYGKPVTDADIRQAQNAYDIAKLKVDNPKLYASYVVIEDPNSNMKARQIAADEIMKTYGITQQADTRTDAEYAADQKKKKNVEFWLSVLNDRNAAADEKEAAEKGLKGYGLDVESGKQYVNEQAQKRTANAEYEYYKNGLMNELTYAGKKPEQPVNKQETDQLYRAVNQLTEADVNDPYLRDDLPIEEIQVAEVYGVNRLQYLTPDEVNAYNYIYETEGLKAANQYIKDNEALRNVRAAEAGDKRAKELVNKNFGTRLGANLMSIAANAAGNVPAMLEKLVTGVYNIVDENMGGRNALWIDTNDITHEMSNFATGIRSETSQRILENNPGTSGKVYNFIYQGGMSMADSAVAMTFAYCGAPGAVDVLFFSSAGNEAYKDAMERGATQEQALSLGVLSGAAEAIFEHASVENFLNLDYQGKGRLIKNMLMQAGVEGSEEVNTEIANILSDVLIMENKADIQSAIDNGTVGSYLLEHVGMAGLGGLASGLGFGVFGAVPNAASQISTGREVKRTNTLDSYTQRAALLGGDAQRMADEVKSSSKVSDRLAGALVQQVNKQVQEQIQGEGEQADPDKGAAMQAIMTGDKLTVNGAKAVMDTLGEETIKGMGYDTSSPSAFAKSYKDRLEKYGVQPKASAAESQRARAEYQFKKDYMRTPVISEAARAVMNKDVKDVNVISAKANAANRVWANPEQGMKLVSEGRSVTPMPGNMTAVAFAEQERSGFKTRTEATTGKVTYAISGMQAREGLTNEQRYSEIQKGLTKEARQKAKLYEALSDALNMKMVIHDVMVGTNGFIDENGVMHVVLSGRQSVLRVAAHELTHYMKAHAAAEYASLRKHLVNEVGQERFDRLVKQKAKEYGIDTSTEKGRQVADDEVCAELCERMLSNEEALEKFAEKDTAAAKTLREHLLKILNAIKAAFKRAENRDFGESWSDLIKSRDTIENWITTLQTAISNAESRAQTNEGQIAQTAGVTASAQNEMLDDLFMSEADTEKEANKKAAEANADKGTYVRGIKTKEMDTVLSQSMYGDKENYEGAWDQSRSMVAQLVPDALKAIREGGDSREFEKRMDAVFNAMLDNYTERTNGDGMADDIPSRIYVDTTAKGDLKSQDTNLFAMSAKISKALGRKVTLTNNDSNAMKLDELWTDMQSRYNLKDADDFSNDITKLLDYAEEHGAKLQSFDEAYGRKARTEVVNGLKDDFIASVLDMAEKSGEYSLDTDYMRLAEKQNRTLIDDAKLRNMVTDAARKAGYTIHGYHRTAANFNVFSKERQGQTHGGDSRLGRGFYFADNAAQTSRYSDGSRVIDAYLKMDNPLDLRGEIPANLKRKIDEYYEGKKGEYESWYPVTIEQYYDNLERLKQIETENPAIFLNRFKYDNNGNMTDGIREFLSSLGYDGIISNYEMVVFEPDQIKSADPVTYDDKGNIIPLSERFRTNRTGSESWKNEDIRYSLDTDEARKAFTTIDTAAIEKGLESLKNVTPGRGLWALKDISRFLDSVSGGNKELRNTLGDIFEKPHSEATGRYARGVERMQAQVTDIANRAGVCDEKGGHFDKKKSAAIQNYGEGFSNTYTTLKYKVKDAEHVTVQAFDPETEKLVVAEKDYTLKDLRKSYGSNVADFIFEEAYRTAQKAKETGKELGWNENTVNTRPYTIADLKKAFPDDWQKLESAANEFRNIYDDYIRNTNNMLATIYPIENEYADVDKLTEGIAKKEKRLADHKAAVEKQIAELTKSLEETEAEIAGKRKTDTNVYRKLGERANRISDQIEKLKTDIDKYEAHVKDEIVKMNALKAEMQNAISHGETDPLKRMHRLQYRSDYFHHFQEQLNGVQNLKSIFTDNTDISPAIVGKSDQTRAKTKYAGYFQERMGADYTADAINGMLKYVQLAEYKLAFDPLAAYLREVNQQLRDLDKTKTNRDNLIRYIEQWTNAILGKSHTIDRAIIDSGFGFRSKVFKTLDFINSRVIQNTLLFNMRSALVQASNLTNAKGIVKNNFDWMNGLRAWALARKGDEAMAAIMAQSNFLASRYMDTMQLTDSTLKNAKKFAGWMLGALDEFSCKATWWAAYTQFNRMQDKSSIEKTMGRSYSDAVEYADDVCRRTHAGRGVGELAPAMTSRVVNLVAPFQVEVNNTWQLLKDNIKRKNYLGLLSTGLSVFVFNTIFEAIVGSTPLGFDFARAVMDIVMGLANDDPDDDDDDYGVTQIGQRLAGELASGLPFAGQIAGIVGQDTAKKFLGEDTDVTRYGNTQIGLAAVENTLAGVKDLGDAALKGKNLLTETNFIADIDDLLNILMPMGAKQLTRTIEGVKTVAHGYSSKVDKEGEEKIQFITDGDISDYIQAALFGKWSLTEASEYFGEKRVLPSLFGKYNGDKHSLGKPVDAKEYKAALETGIDGKSYFGLKEDLKKYTTDGGKRSELMMQSYTPEQKAKLDVILFTGKDKETKSEGAVVYQKNSDGEWEVKADYTNQDLLDLSLKGNKTYVGTKEVMEKTGLPQDQAALAADMWDQAKKSDNKNAEFRKILMDNPNLTVEQKESLDKQFIGNKYAADYANPDLAELSTTNHELYEKAKTAKAQGIDVDTFTGLHEKQKAYTGDNRAAYVRQEIMNSNLTAKQKELLDDLLVSDKGFNPDYSSQAWFEVSMLGKYAYEEAKNGAKIGLKPETYLAAYKKSKTINGKDENGKTHRNLKKKRVNEYLDGLTISAPVRDYLYHAVFGYK